VKHSRDLAKAVSDELPKPGAQMHLRGCPFCGSKALQAVRATQENGELGDFNIECTICLGAGPAGGTLQEAGARWNLRG
jgi:Lar family restriction alleviation protein